jgi:hypothetical protein
MSARFYPGAEDFDPYSARIQPGSTGRFHIVVGVQVVATFTTETEAAEFLYGHFNGSDYIPLRGYVTSPPWTMGAVHGRSVSRSTRPVVD